MVERNPHLFLIPTAHQDSFGFRPLGLLPTTLFVKTSTLYNSTLSAFFSGFLPFIQRSPPGQVNNDGIEYTPPTTTTTTTTTTAAARRGSKCAVTLTAPCAYGIRCNFGREGMYKLVPRRAGCRVAV